MSAQQDVKRSTKQKYQDEHLQLNLLPDGVGARQKDRHSSGEGGGYLNICTGSKLPLMQNHVSQLRELALMGVSKTWRNVAEKVGVETFLKVWQILDQEAEQGAEIDRSIRVTVPRFDKYMRYQRNQVIRSMAREGKSSGEIQKHLRRKMNIHIHIRTIQRIVKQMA